MMKSQSVGLRVSNINSINKLPVSKFVKGQTDGRNSTIQLTETNTELPHATNYADWAATFASSATDASSIIKERDRLEELILDCHKRIEALLTEVSKRCHFSLGDIVEVNPENRPRYWFVIQYFWIYLRFLRLDGIWTAYYQDRPN